MENLTNQQLGVIDDLWRDTHDKINDDGFHHRETVLADMIARSNGNLTGRILSTAQADAYVAWLAGGGDGSYDDFVLETGYKDEGTEGEENPDIGNPNTDFTAALVKGYNTGLVAL